MRLPAIKYDMALNAEGVVVHIHAAERGGMYACAGCEKRLIAKKGKVNAHHFAHHPGEEIDCDPGFTIHNLAVRVIAQSHATARDAERAYWLETRCLTDGCGTSVPTVDLASAFARALTETALVEGTRSDVAFRNMERTLIVEVVVTHPVERETMARYERAGADVFTVSLEQLDWRGVERLSERVIVDEGGQAFCECCERLEREEAAMREARIKSEAWANLVIDRLRQESVAPIERKPDEIDCLPDAFYADEFVRLTAGERRFCFVVARTLNSMGFTQTNRKKLFLFHRTVSDGKRRVSVWARLAKEYGVGIRPTFFTSLRYDACRNGHSDRGEWNPYDYEPCGSCEGMRAADITISERMESVFNALRERGRRPR